MKTWWLFLLLATISCKDRSSSEFRVNTADENDIADELTYKGCQLINNKNVTANATHKFEVKQLQTDSKKRAFSVRAGINNSAGNQPSLFEFSSESPVYENQTFVIWQEKLKVTTEFDGMQSYEGDGRYIEMKTSPQRKVFALSGRSYYKRSFGTGVNGPPNNISNYKLYVFDNRGNFTSVYIEVDKSKPPKRFFQVEFDCQPNDHNSDKIGFSALRFRWDADVPFFPSGVISQDELPQPQPGDEEGIKINAQARKDLAQKILANKNLLSSAREKFAKSLLDDSYKQDPAWQLRNLILKSFEFVPEPQKQ